MRKSGHSTHRLMALAVGIFIGVMAVAPVVACMVFVNIQRLQENQHLSVSLLRLAQQQHSRAVAEKKLWARLAQQQDRTVAREEEVWAIEHSPSMRRASED